MDNNNPELFSFVFTERVRLSVGFDIFRYFYGQFFGPEPTASTTMMPLLEMDNSRVGNEFYTSESSLTNLEIRFVTSTNTSIINVTTLDRASTFNGHSSLKIYDG